MKKLTMINSQKWLVGCLFGLTLVIITLFKVADTSAYLPLQVVPQSDFGGVAQTSPSGSTGVESQEVQMDVTYFAENGDLTGLVVTPAGLSLAAGEVEGIYTSGVIHSPLPFTTDIVPLWRAILPEGTVLRLETRLSADGGASWSEWLENPEAFYPVRDDLHSGNLIWVGHDQLVLQFRVILRSPLAGVSPTLSRLILAFNDTSQGPTDAEIAGQMVNVSSADDVCPVDKPAVVSRTAWGNPEGQHSPRRPPTYAPVTHIVIHQTETPNGTQPYHDWAGWVRSIWNFHANVLWWGDVGYNYLIDPNGVIYEGRAGGDNVVGIHDTHNIGSMAIGFIGCYGNCDDPRLSVTEPTQAMLDAAVHLMAWKLGQQGIDPLSRASYHGLNDIPVIAGGRDVTWTTSPGDKLYNRLPDLRAGVAEKNSCSAPPPDVQACQITGVIFDKEMYDVGEIINLTVRLADHMGTPLVGANVVAEVTRRPLSVQASTGFGLVDRAGEYDGVFSNTENAGFYDFSFIASDPTGERFAPCTAVATVLVAGDPAPTPTTEPTTAPTAEPTGEPTPEPTTEPTTEPTIEPTTEPTAEPTTEPTPEPTGTILKVEPESLVIPICSSQESVTVNVENVTNFSAVQLEVTYDPTVIQVIDARDSQEGVQVNIGDAFSTGFIAQNIVNTGSGRIFFAATLFGGDKIDGNAGLIRIDWQPQKNGTSAVTLENVILVSANGQVIDFTPQNGTVEVISNCAGVTGVVALQGRTDHSGVIVTSDTGAQTQTTIDGSFNIASGDVLSFEFPGYLSAQADVRVRLELGQATKSEADFQPASLGSIVLLAGDVNGDDVINIFDLAYLGGRYQSDNPTADLNADGIVDIMDLALAASNYRQRGPLTAWQ